MRRHLHRAQFVDEIVGVIGFVSAQGNRLTPIRPRLDHVKLRDPLAVSVGSRKAGVNHEAVPHEAELGLLALAFDRALPRDRSLRRVLRSIVARNSFSGGIEGHPIGEYGAENSRANADKASFTIKRIERSG